MKTRIPPLAALFAVAQTLLGGDIDTYKETWPQWRGPSRDGIYSGRAWPESLDSSRLQLKWRQELAPGYSSPVLNNDLVYTVETERKENEIVRAFDRRTGNQVWRSEWVGAMKVPFFASANGSWVRCTPLLDDERLYVGGMRDVLVCLDARSGRERWRFDFPAKDKTPLPSFGFVSSPVIHGDHLYVQAGGGFVKLDKKTGAKVWKTLGDGGGMFGSAFSSPVIGDIQGQTVAVVQTRTELTGVDLDSGAALWKQPVKAFRGMNILTPVIHKEYLFTSTYGGRSTLFQTVSDDDGIHVETVWDNKLQGYMSTPVVVADHAYLHLRNTRIACVNLADGGIRWTSSKTFGKYMSMVAQGDRILGLDQKGKLYLLNASTDELDIVAERKVSDQETWAHLAIADGQLFVRELNGISVFDWH